MSRAACWILTHVMAKASTSADVYIAGDMLESFPQVMLAVLIKVSSPCFSLASSKTSKSGRRLFFEAGLSDYKIIPVLGVRAVFEVYP